MIIKHYSGKKYHFVNSGNNCGPEVWFCHDLKTNEYITSYTSDDIINNLNLGVWEIIKNSGLSGRPSIGSFAVDQIQNYKRQGKSQQEIAIRLNCSITTVRRYWNKPQDLLKMADG
jgi:hypothetical protein